MRFFCLCLEFLVGDHVDVARLPPHLVSWVDAPMEIRVVLVDGVDEEVLAFSYFSDTG